MMKLGIKHLNSWESYESEANDTNVKTNIKYKLIHKHTYTYYVCVFINVSVFMRVECVGMHVGEW